MRSSQFASFLSGKKPLLVCTDITSRGLDTTAVGDILIVYSVYFRFNHGCKMLLFTKMNFLPDHVVIFDFPLNAIDYLHRAGRTGYFQF
jgi:superfamily II DNA/RNA helicase